ncbi:hypothetical protein [Pampinifervens florentissimum]|uniref:hypothetical protein n=1 Tax=Pampinifervens florentissimum TaxID=1632019 RepID=UPI0013B48872|nr:hypothetical protein [Hydrogenobacter sp. T-8]QID33313.1 hypothetical protein G3M65_05845 [Hydrogenobacter sp. T-8]
MVKLLLIVLLFGIAFPKEVPFTLEDRDRMIRLEEGQKAIMHRFEQIDKRFEQVERQIDRLIDIMLAIFAGQIALVATVIGVLIWDRRTVVKKATDDALEKFESGKFKNLLEAMKDLAKEDERIARALKKYNLL